MQIKNSKICYDTVTVPSVSLRSGTVRLPPFSIFLCFRYCAKFRYFALRQIQILRAPIRFGSLCPWKVGCSLELPSPSALVVATPTRTADLASLSHVYNWNCRSGTMGLSVVRMVTRQVTNLNSLILSEGGKVEDMLYCATAEQR